MSTSYRLTLRQNDKKRRPFFSEYVAACLSSVGIHITWNAREFIAPGDIAKNPAILWED